MASYSPLIGNWYQELETGQIFEVVAVDEKHGTIEVQFGDGDIGEYDVDMWESMSLAESEAPEDAYIGIDGSNTFDDEGPTEEFYMSANPIESIEPDVFLGFDDPL